MYAVSVETCAIRRYILAGHHDPSVTGLDPAAYIRHFIYDDQVLTGTYAYILQCIPETVLSSMTYELIWH